MNPHTPLPLRALLSFTFIFCSTVLILTACGRRDEPKIPASGSTNKPTPTAQNTKKAPAVTNNQPADVATMAVDPRIEGTWKWDEAGSVGSMTFNPASTYY